VQLEGLGKLKKSTSSGTRTGDLPACSIVPQPTTEDKSGDDGRERKEQMKGRTRREGKN
jgi:hypothetical protein